MCGCRRAGSAQFICFTGTKVQILTQRALLAGEKKDVWVPRRWCHTLRENDAKRRRYAYVSIRQHTSAYVSIRQHTYADACHTLRENDAKRRRYADVC